VDKRTLIALVLVFVVFWLSNEFLWKNKEPVQPTIVETTEEVATNSDNRALNSESKTETNAALSSHLFSEEVENIDDEIILQNDRMSLTFTNQGGLLTSVKLKDFTRQDYESIVDLIPEEKSLLGVRINTDTDTIYSDQLIFNWEKRELDGYPAVVFYLGSSDGSRIEKRFILKEDYNLVMELGARGIESIRDYNVDFSSGLPDTEAFLKQKGMDYRFVSQVQNVQKSILLRKINGSNKIDGNIDWAAIRSKYFVMALIPEQRLQTDHVRVFKSDDSPAFDLTVKASRTTSELSDEYSLYLGPMEYDRLKAFSIGLEGTMELGWKFIRPLGRLFLWLLRNIYRLIPNYGVAIIFFALILKLVLYPLTHKSFESSHKMQRMNPYMQEIQQKYKSDPQQMQKELQKLYKEHGVSPLGGCLPLLLQMPVFFALYPVLRYAIELRQASFGFWLNDLSEPDPYIILPIVMGIFMFVQQKMMMPKSVDKDKMDEKQLAQLQSQKMMLYVMPVFMVFIFRSLPSGLVLYWTVFNIFSIIQQHSIKKKFK